MLLLFIITLVLFLSINTIDLGPFGKIYYIGNFSNDPLMIPNEIYLLIVIAMVVFGIFALRDIIQNKPDNYKLDNFKTENYILDNHKLEKINIKDVENDILKKRKK